MSGYQPLDVQPKAVGMVNSQPTLETTLVQSFPSDNLALSLFTCLCCFWPLGIVALLFSCSARDSYDRGDIAEGESSAWTAKMLSLAGIGVGVAILIAAAIAVVIILWN